MKRRVEVEVENVKVSVGEGKYQGEAGNFAGKEQFFFLFSFGGEGLRSIS